MLSWTRQAQGNFCSHLKSYAGASTSTHQAMRQRMSNPLTIEAPERKRRCAVSLIWKLSNLEDLAWLTPTSTMALPS